MSTNWDNKRRMEWKDSFSAARNKRAPGTLPEIEYLYSHDRSGRIILTDLNKQEKRNWLWYDQHERIAHCLKATIGKHGFVTADSGGNFKQWWFTGERK